MEARHPTLSVLDAQPLRHFSNQLVDPAAMRKRSNIARFPPASRGKGRARSRGRRRLPTAKILTAAAFIGAFCGVAWSIGGNAADDREDQFSCPSVRVVDGDTLRCGDRRVRLQGIDAPEMPGHCRRGRQCTPGDPVASTRHLESLVGRGPLTCRATDTDRYGRTVARCYVGDADLSCEQVRTGHAVQRYAPIWC